MDVRAAAAIVAFAIAGPAVAETTPSDGERLPFADAGGRALTLDPGPAPAERGARPVVLVVGPPVDAAAPDDSASVAAAAAALRATGVAAVVCDWRRDHAPGDLDRALRFLRSRAVDLALDPERLALHAVGDGVQGALDAVMEASQIGSALSIAAGAGVVIETLRDVPLLLVTSASDPARTRACLREFAFQAELCGLAARTIEAEGAAAAAAVARFHADLLRAGPPPDPSSCDDPEQARAFATVAAVRGDVAATLRWLEREEDLESVDATAIVQDGAFTKVRSLPVFRDWLASKAAAAPIVLCRDHEPGARLTLRGRVVRGAARTPVAGALLHVWQTDAAGLYTHGEGGDAAARLFGYVRTDAEGRFTLRTIRPGGYPRTMIPSHLHVAIDDGGAPIRPIEFLFDDDPRLVDSARRRAAAWRWPIVVLREEDGALVGDVVVELG